MARKRVMLGLRGLTLLVIVVLATATAVLWFQARRTPDGPPDYVALGSSLRRARGWASSRTAVR